MAENINTQNQTEGQEMPSTNKGGLVVMVTTAGGTRPIMDAHVIVSRREGNNEQILRTLTTNANGRTFVIELPAPPKSNSMSPGEPLPYFVYNIRVDYPGYYTVENLDVPIFPGIVAVQPINLVPLPLDTYNGKTKFFNEQEPSDLVEEESGEQQ